LTFCFYDNISLNMTETLLTGYQTQPWVRESRNLIIKFSDFSAKEERQKFGGEIETQKIRIISSLVVLFSSFFYYLILITFSFQFLIVYFSLFPSKNNANLGESLKKATLSESMSDILELDDSCTGTTQTAIVSSHLPHGCGRPGVNFTNI